MVTVFFASKKNVSNDSEQCSNLAGDLQDQGIMLLVSNYLSIHLPTTTNLHSLPCTTQNIQLICCQLVNIIQLTSINIKTQRTWKHFKAAQKIDNTMKFTSDKQMIILIYRYNNISAVPAGGPGHKRQLSDHQPAHPGGCWGNFETDLSLSYFSLNLS